MSVEEVRKRERKCHFGGNGDGQTADAVRLQALSFEEGQR